MSQLQTITLEYLNLKTQSRSTRHAWRGADGKIRLSQLRDAPNNRLMAVKNQGGIALQVRPTSRLNDDRLSQVVNHLLDGRHGPARNILGCP